MFKLMGVRSPSLRIRSPLCSPDRHSRRKAPRQSGCDASVLLLSLRHGDGKHAVLEAGLDLVGFDRPRQPECPLERPIGPFNEVVVLLLVLALELLLGPDHEDIIFQANIDVILADPRQLGTDFQLSSVSLTSICGINIPPSPPCPGRTAFARAPGIHRQRGGSIAVQRQERITPKAASHKAARTEG